MSEASSFLPLTQSQDTNSSIATGGNKSSAPSIELPPNSHIITSSYIAKYTNGNDLLRRLSNILQVLRHDESIEADSPEWPGLAGVSEYVVANLISHKDKEVRLFAVLICMEIFTIYAPEVRWDRDEIIDIFLQTVRQLANLAHVTDPNQPNFGHYAHILDLFAQIKIGCVIVDLAQQEGTILGTDQNISAKANDDFELDSNIKTPSKGQNRPATVSASTTTERAQPLEVVVELIHTLLHSVRSEHPVEILELVQQAIVACLDEYNSDQGAPFPISILDELLLCIGQGPTIWVVNAAAHQQLATSMQKNDVQKKENSKTNLSKKTKNVSPSQCILPLHVEQTNPTYVTAAAIIRAMLNKLATPVAQLLNGLLNGDPFLLEQSSIRCPTSFASNPTDKSPGARDLKISEGSGDVYSIVYELHRVAPQILTTVIGTVSSGLTSPDTAQRAAVANLLGRLFSAPPNVSSISGTADPALVKNIASEFRACYREWLGRSNDKEPSIRVQLMNHCVAMLKNGAHLERNIIKEASETIIHTLLNDLNADVRLEAIHRLTDWIYGQSHDDFNSTKHELVLPTQALLHAVGSRCSSKHKQERRDAVTGLAKIYNQKYMNIELKSVISGGDDCDIKTIQDVLHRIYQSNHDDYDHLSSHRKERKAKSATFNEFPEVMENESDYDRYSWIASTVFECLYFNDNNDPEMHSRVFQIIDEVLLGSTKMFDKHASKSEKPEKMTETSRSVGFAIVLDSLNRINDTTDHHKSVLTCNRSLRDEATMSISFKYMHHFLTTRSKLQISIRNYIDARASIRDCIAGSEAAMTAEANAIALLEIVGKASNLVSSKASSSPAIEDITGAFHSARDKHIFRILSSVVDPNHSMQARKHALDELPKRTKSLGNGVSEWIKQLVSRCCMSYFLNTETVHHAVLLAQELFRENDIESTMIMLSCVKVAVEIFPALGAREETFVTLTELFSDCRQETSMKVKKKLNSSDIVTGLSAILSVASSMRSLSVSKGITQNNLENFVELQKQLMKLCTHDGTPEQARNAVYTLSRLLSRKQKNDDGTGSLSVKSSQSSIDQDLVEVSNDLYTPLLHALASSSKLNLNEEDQASSSPRIVSILSALSALSECAPSVISLSLKGKKAFTFALQTVIMGKGDENIETAMPSDAELETEETLTKTPSSTRKKRRPGYLSPMNDMKNSSLSSKNSVNVFEDNRLSFHCRRLCAAIDFVVNQVRSSILSQLRVSGQKPTCLLANAQCPTADEIPIIFNHLIQILQNKGLPVSTRDRRHCRGYRDRAALRQLAATRILRLCDGRLCLEQKFLSPQMWHALSESFLDEDFCVRHAVIDELSSLLTGNEWNGMQRTKLYPKPPALRFLSLITLCSDGDHGIDNDLANAGAANVGKTTHLAKNVAMPCIINLRQVTDASLNQCRAIGKDAVTKFESRFKMLVMPEYTVPYALHLLAHRRETPEAGASVAAGEEFLSLHDKNENEESSEVLNDESQQRILRKRLRLLFEPLVQSLGDGADNISFLIQMTELLDKYHTPVDTSSYFSLSIRHSAHSANLKPIEGDPLGSDTFSTRQDMVSQRLKAKLKMICSAAREVLMSFVKKDVNLSSYPGTIQVPVSLFTRADRGSILIYAHEGSSGENSSVESVIVEATSLSKTLVKTPTKKQTMQPKGKSPSDKDPLTRRPLKTLLSIETSNQICTRTNDLKSVEKMSQPSIIPVQTVVETSQPKTTFRKSNMSIESSNDISLSGTVEVEPINCSSRKSRVRFSPELEGPHSLSGEIGGTSTKESDFGDISPIVALDSPPSISAFKGKAVEDTEIRGMTTLSQSWKQKTGTILAAPGQSSISTHENVPELNLADKHDGDDVIDSASGASGSSIRKKRKQSRNAFLVQGRKEEKKSRKSNNTIPTHIKLNKKAHITKKNDKYQQEQVTDDLDFECGVVETIPSANSKSSKGRKYAKRKNN